MPFALGWEPRGVLITYSGALSAGHVLECHRRIAGDARFDDLRFAIVDTSPVQSISISPSDVAEIDALLQGPAWTNPWIKVVIVATRADVLQVLALHETMTDTAFKFEVRESVEAARALVAAAQFR